MSKAFDPAGVISTVGECPILAPFCAGRGEGPDLPAFPYGFVILALARNARTGHPLSWGCLQGQKAGLHREPQALKRSWFLGGFGGTSGTRALPEIAHELAHSLSESAASRSRPSGVGAREIPRFA